MSPGKRRSKARVCGEEKRGLRGRVHGEEGGAANPITSEMMVALRRLHGADILTNTLSNVNAPIARPSVGAPRTLQCHVPDFVL
jgi:hypothetical protein